MPAVADPKPDRAVALSTAIVRIAEFWSLNNAKLGSILGLSAPTISRLKRGATELDPASKSFEAGQFLLRLFRSLDALLGSDDAAARRWLDTPNLDLGGKPIEKLDTMRGLIELCDYVDFHRARV
ncbi:antitoxin Xre/MbcA/ParS toxin-binding domain-containing protein [Novosphingobium sp.]|uniref:antitoxin Xre/MbcA/ParS toxin-binding domain-containing protein n=1 Tax=Novosphingobium sp. TaxID=1874826 RepID=UPI002FDD2E40